MYYLLWGLYFIPNLIVVFLCWFTNPIICFFPSKQENGRDKLYGFLNLWSTHDAFVDEGFYGGYWKKPTNYTTSRLTRYWYRLRWLSRNTAYGWTYLLFSIPKGGGFQYKVVKPINFLGFNYNDINIGWKEHVGFERLSYACRPIGLRKN